MRQFSSENEDYPRRAAALGGFPPLECALFPRYRYLRPFQGDDEFRYSTPLRHTRYRILEPYPEEPVVGVYSLNSSYLGSMFDCHGGTGFPMFDGIQHGVRTRRTSYVYVPRKETEFLEEPCFLEDDLPEASRKRTATNLDPIDDGIRPEPEKINCRLESLTNTIKKISFRLEKLERKIEHVDATDAKKPRHPKSTRQERNYNQFREIVERHAPYLVEELNRLDQYADYSIETEDGENKCIVGRPEGKVLRREDGDKFEPPLCSKHKSKLEFEGNKMILESGRYGKYDPWKCSSLKVEGKSKE